MKSLAFLIIEIAFLRVNLIKMNLKYFFFFFLDTTYLRYIAFGLSRRECGVVLDPHRVMVKNILRTSQNGNGTCVPAVHFICICVYVLFKTILSHPLVAPRFFPLIIITCVYVCVCIERDVVGCACGDNQRCSLMSKLFTFRSLTFLILCSELRNLYLTTER